MGTCKYCNRSAGLFRSVHADCERQHQNQVHEAGLAASKLEGAAAAFVHGSVSLEAMRDSVNDLSRHSDSLPGTIPYHLTTAWGKALESALGDGLLDEQEEERLLQLLPLFSLSREQVEGRGYWTTLMKGGVLRDIALTGRTNRVQAIEVPVNLQKGEVAVWAFKGTDYYEDKTRREIVGRSSGVSIRLAKGVYYRLGAFKGTPVTHTERVRIDSGWLVATNKHLYFSGEQKAFRVAYSKIVQFQPFEDGIGIMRDAASAKPQTFALKDGWFAFNLITNLAKQ